MRQLRLRDLRPGMVLRTKGPIKSIIMVFKKDGILHWKFADRLYSEGYSLEYFDFWEDIGDWYIANNVSLSGVCKDE